MAVSFEASAVSASSLPVIDISGLASSSLADREAVGQALRAACLDKGFFYCVGHGVPEGLMEAVFDQSRAFFAQPDAVKQRVHKSHSTCNRGFEQLGGQTLQPGMPPDQKEGYYIGLELPEDDPRVVAGRFNRGPNLWPEDLPGFRPAMKAYFAALADLGERLMAGLALSLGLEETAFAAYCRDPLATLRLLHYPPQPPDDPTAMGAGAHTDFGGLTLLLQDDLGGLQVFDADADQWIQAVPIPGSFVVNLGDMIARWTNDTYRSTLHRVINSSGKERYSVPFFYVGNSDYEVRCIPTCLGPGDEPHYPPVTIEDHLRSMYDKTYVTKNG